MSRLPHRQITRPSSKYCKVRRGSWFAAKKNCSWLRLCWIQSFDNDINIALDFCWSTTEMETNIVCKIWVIQALLHSCIRTLTIGAILHSYIDHRCKFHRKLCCFVCSAFVVTQESGFKNSACLLSPVQTRTEQVTINTLNFCWHERGHFLVILYLAFIFLVWCQVWVWSKISETGLKPWACL